MSWSEDQDIHAEGRARTTVAPPSWIPAKLSVSSSSLENGTERKR